MSLAPGSRLGPYEILAPIGAGGMGEVYRARDTTLDREVAIKVLPAALAQDPERLARFKREAKVLASLSHPNIAQIYGVEDRALVMELVAGESPKGPLPIETTLNCARQIAVALEAAHEKGIIHRDLKPANVLITPEGVVKVLDFGLAAVAPASPDGSDPATSPTVTMPTQAGVIMGTAAYMSPEQAAGKSVDRRADIWSFGVVLWEFLTGHRLFDGETVSHTLADVLRGPIDFDKLPRETPPAIRSLLRRCLDRNVKNRLRDIGEARVAIDAVLSGARGGTPESAEPVPAWRSIVPWAVAGVSVAALAFALWAPWRAAQPIEQSSLRVDVDLGPEVSLRPLNFQSSVGGDVVISPDGTRLVYAASVAGAPQPATLDLNVSRRRLKLFTRRLDQPNAVELPGTEGAAFPFFSPDGRWVGFVADSKLNKISVEGGSVVPLGDVGEYAEGAWGEDGNIIVGSIGHGLMQIPSNGGAAAPVTELASGEQAHEDPQILPGGKTVLFTVYGVAPLYETRIEVVSLVDRRRRTLQRRGDSAHYVAKRNGAGYLVYSSQATLFAIPFDLNRLETHGLAVPVLDGVAVANSLGPEFDVSRTGTLVYRKSGGTVVPMSTIQWLDAAGKRQPLLAKPAIYDGVRLSPDGGRLAAEIRDGSNPTSDIWVYEPKRDTMTRLTFGGKYYLWPTWSPDGRYLVFSSLGSGMFWARADGAGQPQQLTQSKIQDFPQSFSPDGKRLAYFEVNGTGGSDRMQVWTIPIEDAGGQLQTGKAEPFLQTQFSDGGGMFSPDGQWLAYSSNESGTREVYVRAFPQPASGQGGKWQISNGGGFWPKWSPKGRELLYESGDQIMAVSYSVKGESFVPEKPRVWVSKIGGTKGFDVSPDGKRLAVVMPVETPEATKPDHEVTFIFNFLDELRRRVPAGK
jgi:Tol biopolymer transport system component